MGDVSLITNIEDKQIIITGLSSELALESFRKYADKNSIYGTYNNNKINVSEENISLYKLNLTDEKEIEKFIEGIKENLQKVILINFAAYKSDGLLANYSPDEWNKTFDINIKANFLLAKHIIPIMISNKWGRIIHISSAKALRNIQQNILPSKYPDKKVLGVIRPTTEEVGNISNSGYVGIMGTAGTVVSNSYPLEISKFS